MTYLALGHRVFILVQLTLGASGLHGQEAHDRGTCQACRAGGLIKVIAAMTRSGCCCLDRTDLGGQDKHGSQTCHMHVDRTKALRGLVAGSDTSSRSTGKCACVYVCVCLCTCMFTHTILILPSHCANPAYKGSLSDALGKIKARPFFTCSCNGLHGTQR